eukprot:8405400-Alexandrium_andersonii.AAC.1
MGKAWDGIYEGNDANIDTTAAFVARFGQWFARGPTVEVPQPSVEWLKEAIGCLGSSAGGADGWLPSELRMMPEAAMKRLVPFFVLVEGGASWPEGLNVAKSVYIGKSAGDTLEATKFRGLLITSA